VKEFLALGLQGDAGAITAYCQKKKKTEYKESSTGANRILPATGEKKKGGGRKKRQTTAHGGQGEGRKKVKREIKTPFSIYKGKELTQSQSNSLWRGKKIQKESSTFPLCPAAEKRTKPVGHFYY